MDVRVLHLDDCGSWRTATERLRQAVARLGSADTQINRVQVDFDAHNDQAVFGGSPTILVDGQDLFPPPPSRQRRGLPAVPDPRWDAGVTHR